MFRCMAAEAQRRSLLPFLVGGAALCLGVGLGLFTLKTLSSSPASPCSRP